MSQYPQNLKCCVSCKYSSPAKIDGIICSYPGFKGRVLHGDSCKKYEYDNRRGLFDFDDPGGCVRNFAEFHPDAKKRNEFLQYLREYAKKNQRTHIICDDELYSCPATFKGLCNCGADQFNAELATLLQRVSEYENYHC